jgi:DNA-binding NarL/FixJ family response regulator
MTRVLIAAASAVVRAGLETLLKASPALEVVGSAAGMGALAGQIESVQPDVILLEMERGRDIALQSVAAAAPVVLLADETDGVDVEHALRLGVRAVLAREADAEEIVAAVQAAAAGLVVLPPGSVDGLLPILSSAPRPLPAEGTETLTPREIEVLGMLAEGAGNKTIARRLGISEHTVKFHVGSILAKLHASSRTEAVTLGVRQGLIML